jgi:hypothetical protein
MPQANGNAKNAIKKSKDIRREKESKYSYAAIVNWEPHARQLQTPTFLSE